MGEQITVKVTSDNTHCEKAMEQVKIRLRCKIDVTATETGWGGWQKTKTIGPLKVAKCHGQTVPKKTNFTQQISFTVPQTLEKGYCPWGYYMPNKQGDVTAHQRAMLQMPCPSYRGMGFDCQWYLEILHKHDAWNEFGDGTAIQLPITLIQGNIEQQNMQAFMAPLQQAQFEQVPEGNQFNVDAPEKEGKGQTYEVLGQPQQ